MSIAYALIIIHSDKIELKPPCPQLEGGLQPFKVGVNWDKNKGFWKKVTVTNFVDGAGKAVYVAPSSHEWDEDETGYKDFDFKPTPIDFFCKYDVILEDSSGNKFTVDPVILIKKPGVLGPLEIVSPSGWAC